MKKIPTFLLVSLCTFPISGLLSAREPRKLMKDDGISRKLLGTWLVHAAWKPAPVPTHCDGMEIYTPDGKVAVQGTLTVAAIDKNLFEYEATWKIENGFLIETLTKSSLPKVFRVGATTRDKIIRIGNRKLTYRTEFGRVCTQTRKPAA